MYQNTERLQKLQQLIYNTLDPLIDKDYCLLDIPDHNNIGDHLISEGEFVYLKRLPHKMHYISNERFCDFKKIPDNSIILLHGGGNFGDLWRRYQEFKIKVIQNFPNNKIVFFPQTVFYNNTEILLKDAEVFNQHPDITICARDRNSFDLLKKHFVNNTILLIPDMAFCLNLNKYITQVKTKKVLILKRRDKEINKKFDLKKVEDSITQNREIEVRDWPSIEKKEIKFRILNVLNYLNERVSKVLINSSVLRRLLNDKYGLIRTDLSKWYMMEGVKFINKYDEIYTTRLHGYILSILLNKKVHIIDNSYGKNSNFYNTWMTDFENSDYLRHL